jgi:hypothetical protein
VLLNDCLKKRFRGRAARKGSHVETMSWVKLDDGFADHPKVSDLSDAAFRLHITALCWIARQETDGVVSEKQARKMGAPRHIDELVTARLWIQRTGKFEIKDYLKYNPSKKQLEAKRKATRERLQRFRGSPGNAVTDDVTDGDTEYDTDGVDNAFGATSPDPQEGSSSEEGDGEDQVSDPDLTDPSLLKDLKARPREQETAQVGEVFAFWKQETGHSRAVLDGKRDARIRARLRQGFTVDQLKAAIRNRRNDPFLMGENDTGRIYDDILTLLRDAAQVERLERLTQPMRPGNRGRAGDRPKQGNGGYQPRFAAGGDRGDS